MVRPVAVVNMGRGMGVLGVIVTSSGHLEPGRGRKLVEDACFTPEFWRTNLELHGFVPLIFSEKFIKN
jgi:hypothetical protein